MNTPDSRMAGDALFDTLAAADALELFRSLPEESQAQFRDWIDKARTAESRWLRIEALVLAMRIGPLYPSEAPDSRLESETLWRGGHAG